MFVVKRSTDNPIINPNKDHYWEAFATFNMSPVFYKGKYYGLYRAISSNDSMQSQHQISIIGIAESKDGVHFSKNRPFILPEKEWDQFGCEDPRVTYFEGKFYVFYTAISKYPLGPEGIKVAVAVSRDLKKINERHFVTPFNAKAMTLFPERINGKIVVIFSAFTDSPPAKMVFAYLDKIEDLWSPVFWEKWSQDIDKYTIDPRRNEFDHVEVGATPIKTKKGWLFVYSHIQNYFKSPENLDTVFGIEALLLDLKNPQKIIGRTRGQMIAPEENYELSGFISNVVFPSGALVRKDTLNIYYGAADTTVCLAQVNLRDLVDSISFKTREDSYFSRYNKNPIIEPIEKNDWEAQATFNPAAINIKDTTYLLYRAMSKDNTSTIGFAMIKDGVKVVKRLPNPIYVPREDFESKKTPNANSGCEDPRLTKIGKEIYMCYTAFDTYGPPRVAMSSIKEKDFKNMKFNWSKPFLITPRDLDDKDTCIVPQKFKQGYFILHRVNNEICGDYVESLKEGADMVNKCIHIIGPRKNMWDSLKVGIASPPIKTKKGWLMLYHGVSKSHSTYRIGALLLDLKDPAIVLARSTEAIFEPEKDYEKFGIVKNVVFPCGMTVLKGKLYIYYGGADKVIGVASMKLSTILNALVHGSKLI